MDNTPPFSKEISSPEHEEKSALQYVQHTAGRERFFYAVYTLLGIFFYGIGIFTFLGFLMHVVDGRALWSLGTVVFICYVLLNGFVGYGFIFHKKWLVVLFGIHAMFMGGIALFFFEKGFVARAEILLINALVALGAVCFLLLTKKMLSGTYFRARVTVSFTVALLISFLLTNLSMLS